MDSQAFLLVKNLAACSRFDLELATRGIRYLWCSSSPQSLGPGNPSSNTVMWGKALSSVSPFLHVLDGTGRLGPRSCRQCSDRTSEEMDELNLIMKRN